MNTDDLLDKEEVFPVIGASMESQARGIPFARDIGIEAFYQETSTGQLYRADSLVFGKILLDPKAIEKNGATGKSQMLNYLKASACRVGLLLNFGAHPKMEWVRLIH